MHPACPTNESQLDELLATPSPSLIECMRRLEGDIMVLGIGGKMGPSLGAAAVRAARAAGIEKTVFGVSRFSTPGVRGSLEKAGIRTVSCDLLDAEAVATLPRVSNVVYMAGRKFGTEGNEDLTWAMNTVAPAHVAEHFARSRICVFSTGCVYPLRTPGAGGCRETDAPAPVGEYAQSCLGRERIFSYYSRRNGTPVCLLRLNYAIELRYGVLHDLAKRIINGKPIDTDVGAVNVIWQGDANCQALLALEHCTSPHNVLNITGPEILSVRALATDIGEALGRHVELTGDDRGAGYLSNATRARKLFGPPRIGPDLLIEWTAQWLDSGGRSLNKPTHFEVQNGKY